MKMDKLVDVFKALGQITRLQIIRLLTERELCVCELTEIMETSQPRISQHLKILKGVGLVSEIVEGPLRVYHLEVDVLQTFQHDFADFMRQGQVEDEKMTSLLTRLYSLEEDFRYRKLGVE